MSTTAVEDRLLSPDELASILGISAYTVRQMARDREIPSIRLGRFWKFRRSSVEAWMSQRERAAR